MTDQKTAPATPRPIVDDQGLEPLVLLDELRRRKDHKYCLEGVTILHQPSGYRFTATGSLWNERRELVVLHADGKINAKGCVLLSRWPLPNSARMAGVRELNRERPSS